MISYMTKEKDRNLLYSLERTGVNLCAYTLRAIASIQSNPRALSGSLSEMLADTNDWVMCILHNRLSLMRWVKSRILKEFSRKTFCVAQDGFNTSKCVKRGRTEDILLFNTQLGRGSRHEDGTC